MGLLNNTLSEREKAALYYHIFTGCKDWQLLYIIATNQPEDDARKDIHLSQYASRWKLSGKVQKFLSEERDKRAVWEQRERERIEKDIKQGGESERKEPERKKALIDYSNPENRQRLYNEVIAKAGDDPKTQLDAAKMFEQIQRDDKQAAREQKQVRAYLPLSCQDCPLYKKSKKLR